MISNNLNGSIVTGETNIPLQPLIDKAIEFIDEYLPLFPESLKLITPKIEIERLLNQQLVDFFNGKTSDFFPYLQYKFIFRKDDENNDTLSKPDIGITIWDSNISVSNPNSFFQIECKRLPTPNPSKDRSEKEYVIGTEKYRGGIERFKNNKHGDHLFEGALIAYVQSESLSHWHTKITTWIKGEIDTTEKIYKWDAKDYLVKIYEKKRINKYHSICARNTKAPIKLYHYLLDVSN